jgi:hypothetical protein
MSTSLTPAQIFPSDKGLDHMIINGVAAQLSGSKQRIALPKKILALSCDELKAHIREMANGIYGDKEKDGQIDAVAHLVHSEHTFVLAGTGFVKTRIAKIYSMLFKPYQKAVIVVLNPLDALGDNQVPCRSISKHVQLRNWMDTEVIWLLTYIHIHIG